MLLGVIREAGELDSGASSVAADPETAGLSTEHSVWKKQAGMSSMCSDINRQV